MVNLFGQVPPPQQDPQSDGTGDSVEEAVAQMIAAQQQNEPSPRPPTPQEVEQIKQGVQQMKQAQGAPEPDQGPPLPANLTPMGKPIPPSGPPGGSAFMGMGGMNPSIAQQQTTSNPTPSSPAPFDVQGPPVSPSAGGFGYYPPGPGMTKGGSAGLEAAGNIVSPLGNAAAAIAQGELGKEPPKKEFKSQTKKPETKAEEIAEGPQEQSSEQPEASEADEQGQLKQEPNAPTVGNVGTLEPEHLKYIAEVAAPQAAKIADGAVKSGVNTPEKAYAWLRSKYAGDPELDQAIADAKATYEEIKAKNNEEPSTGKIIGAVLMGLLGVHPQVIQNVLGGNKSMQREQMAGESLLKLQLQRASGLRHQAELDQKQGQDSMAQRRLDQQQSMFNQGEAFKMNMEHQKEQRELWNKQFTDASQKATKLREMAGTAIGTRKAQLEADAKDADNLSDFYRQMMGGPSRQQMEQQGLPKKPAPVMPKPTSMAPQQPAVSPSAMRLLGMGNA